MEKLGKIKLYNAAAKKRIFQRQSELDLSF